MQADNYDCDKLRELIPAYSIGATDTDETLLVESMLPECPEAMADLSQYLALADALLYSVNGQNPLPQSQPLDSATRATTFTSAPEQSQAKPVAKIPDQISTGFIAKPVSFPRTRRYFTLAAAVWLILLVSSNVYWLTQVDQFQKKQAELTALLAERTPSINGDINRIHYQQLGTENAAHATVIWDSQQVGTLYVKGLPPLGENKVYQLWIVRNNHEISLGAFKMNKDGVGTLVFKAPEPIESFQVMGISAEPAPSSPQPTGNMQLIGKIEG